MSELYYKAKVILRRTFLIKIFPKNPVHTEFLELLKFVVPMSLSL